MQKLLIKGKKEIKGNIYISGSKNATLPILASTILASEVRLLNVPFVKDIFTMLELLKFIGIKVKMKRNKNILELKNEKKEINTLAPYKLVKTMRAGVLVLGPLLTKFKKAKVSLPGGCAIGTRPVDLHLFALKKLGAKIKIKDGYIIAEARKGLMGTKIKESIFENRFMHVPELKRMGANIEIKNKIAIIKGPSKLTGAEVMATDLRASVSLVLAGLVADNRTIINRIYHLDRGYEFLEKKLQNCKARIKRI